MKTLNLSRYSLVNIPEWFLRAIRHEAHVSWQFIAGDISSSVVPPMLFLIAACAGQPALFGPIFWSLARGLLYFWLFIYMFCLSNQIAGIAEDRINKPHRPLVRGLISYRGAWIRWAVVMLLFAFVGWWFDVLIWALLWEAAATLHNFGGWSRHWYTKNLVMSLGVYVQLAAAWQLVAPITPIIWLWIVLLSVAIFLVIAVQDLRDLDGDRDIGRHTFPLVFGETLTRVLLGLSFSVLPLAIHFGLMLSATMSWTTILCDAVLAGFSLVIAWRVLCLRGPQADHRTYMFLTYWYCIVLGSAIIVL